jgi:hypothetical protein
MGCVRLFELIRPFPLRPIRSDDELGQAIALIDSLLAQPSLDMDEDDCLEVLGDLVLARYFPVSPVGLLVRLTQPRAARFSPPAQRAEGLIAPNTATSPTPP